MTSVGGNDIYLRDVAEIKDTVGERRQENFVNGKSGAIVMITKQEGSNSVEIARQIRAALPEIQQNLPSDVKIGYLIDTSSFIVNTIDSLQETIIITFRVVVLVVLFSSGAGVRPSSSSSRSRYRSSPRSSTSSSRGTR